MYVSLLPAALQKGSLDLSFISHHVIHGPAYTLEDDSSQISVAEAIMWGNVNPFSPLNTGYRINGIARS